MAKEKTLRIVIVEESENDAEALANILRNAGNAVRSTYVEDLEALEQALQNQSPDLLLCAMGLDTIQLEDIVARLGQEKLNTPVIAIAESCDEPAIIAALRMGASDLASYDQPDHLQLIVAREVKSLKASREAQEYRRAFSESEKRARNLMESSRDAITYIHDGMHIYANRSYLEMFGFDELEEIEGTPILDMVSPDDHAMFKDFLRSYGRGSEEGTETLELNGMLPDGSTFKAVMEFTPATIEGEPCTQIIIRSQSDSKELEKKLKYLSKQDMLTGLFNRQYFMEELELAVTHARAGSGTSAVLYLLLDNFKGIKEGIGITAADNVVREVADLLRDTCQESDVLARFGDHAFTVIRRDCEVSGAQSLAEELRKAVEGHIADVDSHSITTTCSIGVSLVTESAPPAQQVLSQADLACEVARAGGANQVHLHNPVSDEKAGKDREKQWSDLIKTALEEDRFRLLYQPIVSLQGDHQEKYEVFLRMIDEEGDSIMPGQFIETAEQSGQIAEIDRWVIRNAVNVLAQRRSSGIQTTFFIKLSGQTLADAELPIWIREQMVEHKLGPDSVVFEIAEQTAQQHLKHAKAFMKAMQQLDYATALEHFGSGPNSFQLLKHLPADYLKIDGSFIHNLASDNANQAMVKSILDLAQSMQKKCIAEFVQDPHSLAVLWQQGIHYIQGNFLQEPDESLNYDFSDEVA